MWCYISSLGKRESDGKPSGKYEYTSLKGGDVKKVFRKLP